MAAIAVIKLSVDSSGGEKGREDEKDAGSEVGETSPIRTFSGISTIESSWYPKLAANNDTRQGWRTVETSVE